MKAELAAIPHTAGHTDGVWCCEKHVSDAIDEWHKSGPSVSVTLGEHLGMSDEQYKSFVEGHYQYRQVERPPVPPMSDIDRDLAVYGQVIYDSLGRRVDPTTVRLVHGEGIEAERERAARIAEVIGEAWADRHDQGGDSAGAMVAGAISLDIAAEIRDGTPVDAVIASERKQDEEAAQHPFLREDE
jgi:hypothetical protein